MKPIVTLYRFAPAAAAAAGLCIAASAAAGVANPAAYYPVSIQESELTGYDFEFVIHNCEEGSEISGLYVEEGWDSFFSNNLFDRNLRVDPGAQNLIEGTSSPDLGGWSSSTVSHEIMNGALPGVGTGGTATLAFIAEGDFDIEDLEAAFGTDGFGLGLRIFDLDDESNSYLYAELGDHEDCLFDDGENGDDGGDGGDGGDEGDNGSGGDDGDATGIPTPSAALMGLALLGLAGTRRRRNL